MTVLSYGYIHELLAEFYGRASEYDCVNCSRPAVDWSYQHGTDSSDINNYEPRCRSCHMLYDNPTQGSKNGHAILDEEDVIEIRALHATGKWNHREIAEIYKVNRRTITQIINRVKWRHI